MSQALQLDHSALRRKRKPGIRLLLIINNLREKHFGHRRHAAAGHLFRVTHQLIEMNLRRRDKCADPSPPFHHAFALQRSQRVPRRHQAHRMNLCQVALRRDSIPGAQVPGLDSLPEAALNSLVRRQPVASTLTFSRHSRSRNLESAYNESPLSRSLEIVKKDGNSAQPVSFVGFPYPYPRTLCPFLPIAPVAERLPRSARQGACLAAPDRSAVI